MRLIDGCPDEFLVISGDDIIALPMILAGGSGVISVIGQGLPKDFSEMVQHGLAKNVAEAYELHYKIAPSIDYIFAEGNPAGIKCMLHLLKICEASVRLPLVGVSKPLEEKIIRYLDRHKP
jgi:4-hydroxy-tetrahydrodipicolinate synthase